MTTATRIPRTRNSPVDLFCSLAMTVCALVAIAGELLSRILLSPLREYRLRKERRRWIVAGRVLKTVSDVESRLRVTKIPL